MKITDKSARNIAITVALAFVIVMAVMLTDIWGGVVDYPLRFVGDYDSVHVIWWEKDALVWQPEDSAWFTSIPDSAASIELDDAKDWKVDYCYFSGGEQICVGQFIKFTAGAATISSTDKEEIAGLVEDTLKVHHGADAWTTGGAGSGAYTVDIYVFDTLGGATTAVEGATVDWRLWGLGRPSHRVVTSNEFGIGRIHTDLDSLAVRIEDNPFYIFSSTWDSLSWTADYSDSIYGYLNIPAAASSPNYVLAYVDVGEGIIDSASGSMIPRDAIELYLDLIGETTLNDGSWMIVPKRQTKEPDASGRVNFIIPANTVMTPLGSYYILSYRAFDGVMQITGELKRFTVDTIPDPINILDATESR